MPITFPLALADFMDLLSVARVTMSPRESVLQSTTRGGEVLRSDIGARLWGGRIVVAPASRAQMDQQVALAETLLEAQGSFMVARRSRHGPQADPTGAILGAAVPVILAVSIDWRDLSLAGLPAGYVLTRGDLLGFAYGTSPVRHALHRVLTTRTATGVGEITALSVTPLVRPGVTAGTPVTLVRPACKAVIVPESFDPDAEGGSLTEGFAFDWRQTLR